MTTKKKKVYLTLLLTGAAALMADRFLLPKGVAPEFALAADQAMDVDPIQAPLMGATDPVPELHFPRPLPALRFDLDGRDLFAAPGYSDEAVRPDNATVHDMPLHARFAAEHLLQAVLIQGEVRCAVINKKVVKADETVGGCTIVAIGPREVTARCADGDAILRLPAPADARQP